MSLPRAVPARGSRLGAGSGPACCAWAHSERVGPCPRPPGTDDRPALECVRPRIHVHPESHG